MKYNLTVKEISDKIGAKLSHNFGVAPEEATYEHFYKAAVLVCRDLMSEGYKEFTNKANEQGKSRFITSAWNSSWEDHLKITSLTLALRTHSKRL